MAVSLCAGLAWAAASPVAHAATMYSTKNSYMGPGQFFGPGRLPDQAIFDVQISNIGFESPLNFITPFFNNGGGEPVNCGERELGKTPTGLLSDGVTRINKFANTCSLQLNNSHVMMAIVDGGPFQGQQVAVTLVDKTGVTMLMSMDFAMDLGIGKAGIVRLPFYGTTGEVTVPKSLQTQMGIEGGVDRAGSLKPGAKLRGRFGDFNHDGMLDGAIVVAGNIPLNSVLMPGAPYALIRYFETDIPVDGLRIGKLPPGRRDEPKTTAPFTVRFVDAPAGAGAPLASDAP